MNEKLYLFNPFMIKNLSEKELQTIYQDLYKKIISDANTMHDYSTNIETYANLIYICGEVIARLTKDLIELKTKIEINTSINTTEERKHWSESNDAKPPALDYFKALATRMSQDDIKLLADKECSLKRFKNAYDSIEHLINALKRKQDSIKYEEFGGSNS